MIFIIKFKRDFFKDCKIAENLPKENFHFWKEALRKSENIWEKVLIILSRNKFGSLPSHSNSALILVSSELLHTQPESLSHSASHKPAPVSPIWPTSLLIPRGVRSTNLGCRPHGWGRGVKPPVTHSHRTTRELATIQQVSISFASFSHLDTSCLLNETHPSPPSLTQHALLILYILYPNMLCQILQVPSTDPLHSNQIKYSVVYVTSLSIKEAHLLLIH